MTKEETIISNVIKIMNSEDTCELKDSDIYDSLVEENEIFVGGKSFFSEFVFETLSRPLILMLDILCPRSENWTRDCTRVRGVRIIVMCNGEIKMNIMSANKANTSSVIKTFKDEEDWQTDLDMLAWYLTER